jgi:hypothetical protein
MKKLYLLLSIVGILCVATAAHAQTVLKATVPFDFVVRGTTLPASTYTIHKLLPNDSAGLGFVHDREQTLTRASSIDSTVHGARLDFRKIGDKYFLTDIVTPTGKLHFPLSRKDAQFVADVERTSTTSVAAD